MFVQWCVVVTGVVMQVSCVYGAWVFVCVRDNEQVLL